ncbi:FUSC family protein [Nocardiopsis sp. RV163]|uniref:FUSC family protein n=1 Tax=Nocardiopsis sp. RV163 TaxID=1661388 RepID=UPI00064C3859|nr:FUSC family protein [Nocardiopsis sp. RV163]
MRSLSGVVRAGVRSAARAGSAALDRLSADGGSVVQATVAATAAWIIAGGLVSDHSPFFAPIAAVIALNAAGGERGTNAVRMLLGVVIGIVVGELSLAVTGGGYGALAAATCAAMAVAVAFGAARLVIAQAAAGAILTVAFAGTGRLTDALIGAGVALVVSQLLFPARVVSRLRRAEAAALAEMVRLLGATGRALGADEDPSLWTVDRLGALSRPMADLSRARENSHRAVRWSRARWTDPEPLRYEDERIDRLIILGESCLSLARTTAATETGERRRLAPVVCEMASVLDVLAEGLGDRAARQRAVDRVLALVGPFDDDALEDPVTGAAHLYVRMVATDIMLFAGLEPEGAERALAGEDEQTRVAHPPREPWLPWAPRGRARSGRRDRRRRPFRRS